MTTDDASQASPFAAVTPCTTALFVVWDLMLQYKAAAVLLPAHDDAVTSLAAAASMTSIPYVPLCADMTST